MTGLMIIRLGALSRLPQLEPDEMLWLYPIAVDVLVALSAPLIVYQLWRGHGWAFALAFHIVALQDATVGLLFEMMIPMANSEAETSVIPLVMLVAVGALAVWLLSGQRLRAYYFRAE